MCKNNPELLLNVKPDLIRHPSSHVMPDLIRHPSSHVMPDLIRHPSWFNLLIYWNSKFLGRPKPARLTVNEALRIYVQDRLAGTVVGPNGAEVAGPVVRWTRRRHGPRKARRWARAWSPQQISHRLPLDFPEEESMRISHEAIYQALYIQGRGGLRRDLTACLRTGRALRVPRERTRRRGKSFVAPEILISERPAEVADRAVPGHWEGDLILGLRSSAIGTLVERTTRFTLLLHLPPMEGQGPRAKHGPARAGHGPPGWMFRVSKSPPPRQMEGGHLSKTGHPKMDDAGERLQPVGSSGETSGSLAFHTSRKA